MSTNDDSYKSLTTSVKSLLLSDTHVSDFVEPPLLDDIILDYNLD